MAKPARSELFSWRLPIVFTLLLIGGMGASFAWANSGATRFYTDPRHAGVECNVAAGLAAELAAEKPGAAFEGTLVGIAPEHEPTLFSNSAKSLLVWPLKFYCGNAFAKRGLTIISEMPSEHASSARYRFSRIALSEGGRVATVGMTRWCNGACDSAHLETVWRLDRQHWVLVRRTTISIVD